MNREDGELVGALIKGVRAFIRKMITVVPGFKIEIMDGKVKLEYLFTAGLWSQDATENKVLVQAYRKLQDESKKSNLEVKLEPALI